MLLHDVREALQGELLPAAPHRLAVDQGAAAQGGQEEARVPEHQLEDGVTGHTGVGPDQVVGLLQPSVQVLQERKWTHTHTPLGLFEKHRTPRLKGSKDGSLPAGILEQDAESLPTPEGVGSDSGL